MNKRYFAICKQAGLSDEEIRKIDKGLNEEMNNCRKERKGRKLLMEEGNNVFSIQDKEEHHEAADERFELQNPQCNVEEDVIKKILIEQMMEAYLQLSAEDREFIATWLCGGKGIINKMAEEEGVHRNTIIYRRERIIEELRIKMHVSD